MMKEKKNHEEDVQQLPARCHLKEEMCNFDFFKNVVQAFPQALGVLPVQMFGINYFRLWFIL